MTSSDAVVEAASTAAADFIFSHYSRTDVEDLDISVTFEDEELLIDIVLDTGAETEAERRQERQIADDATIVAVDAVDQELGTS